MKGPWEVQSHSLPVVTVPHEPCRALRCQGARAEHEVQAAPRSVRRIVPGAKLSRVSQGPRLGGVCQPPDAVETRAHEHKHLGSGRLELVPEV